MGKILFLAPIKKSQKPERPVRIYSDGYHVMKLKTYVSDEFQVLIDSLRCIHVLLFSLFLHTGSSTIPPSVSYP